MMKIKFYILLLLDALCAASVSAQIVEPVKWRVETMSSSDSLIDLVFTAVIEDGWHLYGTRLPEDGPKPTAFFISDGQGQLRPLQVLEQQQPHSTWDDNFLLQLDYYEHTASFVARVSVRETLEGTVEYMACNDRMCIPPTTWEWTIAVDSDSTNKLAQQSPSVWWIFLMGLLGGFLAIFTPCVWPVIPMTVSFFMKRTKSGKPLRDALLYGLSIILIYVALGLLVTLIFGASALNDIATNAVVNLFFFALLVLFALSFFGAFEITLPASWSTKLDRRARNTSGILSILLMAFTLVIVCFSCTGPIIGTLLVEAAGKSLLAPAAGMLGFSIALALPFSLFAMFPQWMQRLPRSGGWMNSFKVVLAFLELALSLKFFSVADLAYGWHLLDREVFLSLWIVIFALLGFYLLGIFRFRHEEQAQGISVFRFMLAVISLAFSVYLLPGLWGAPLKAISAFAPPVTTQDFSIHSAATVQEHRQLATMDAYNEAFEVARTEGKQVLLDFSGYGCVNCRKMDAKVLADEQVQEALKDYIILTLIVDDKTKLEDPVVVTENGKERELKTVGALWSYVQRTQYGANAQPFYVKLNADGEQIGTTYSYDEDISRFINWLKQ